MPSQNSLGGDISRRKQDKRPTQQSIPLDLRGLGDLSDARPSKYVIDLNEKIPRSRKSSVPRPATKSQPDPEEFFYEALPMAPPNQSSLINSPDYEDELSEDWTDRIARVENRLKYVLPRWERKIKSFWRRTGWRMYSLYLTLRLKRFWRPAVATAAGVALIALAVFTFGQVKQALSPDSGQQKQGQNQNQRQNSGGGSSSQTPAQQQNPSASSSGTSGTTTTGSGSGTSGTSGAASTGVGGGTISGSAGSGGSSTGSTGGSTGGGTSSGGGSSLTDPSASGSVGAAGQCVYYSISIDPLTGAQIKTPYLGPC